MLLGIGAPVKGSFSRSGTRLPFGKDLGLVVYVCNQLHVFVTVTHYTVKIGLHCISYGVLREDIPRGEG